MIIIPLELLVKHAATLSIGEEIPLGFHKVDGGDAFVSTDLPRSQGATQVQGILVPVDISRRTSGEVSQTDASPPQMRMGAEILISCEMLAGQAPSRMVSKSDFRLTGWVLDDATVQPCSVEIVEVDRTLHSRLKGLFETEVLATKRVLIIGLGSGGSTIAIELAKAGVSNFMLVDHDRIEVQNVVRHVCGLPDLGRFKTKAVGDLILDKNPGANVELFQSKCTWEWLPHLSALVERADLVFCCTDNRSSRLLINSVCIEKERLCIYGGAFRRAYGGQIVKCIPGQTMCYQCFIDLMPENAADQEVASASLAEQIAYSDRPVAIEPGMATDIAPISLMCVKLGILEMLRGTNTTLRSLYEDLSSSWYLWLNRREPGTDYADLSPLDSDGDSLRILAWYGVSCDKNPACPVCGDFISSQEEAYNVKMTAEDVAAFAGDGRQDETVASLFVVQNFFEPEPAHE